jgi:negative regulator of flagellin synthesis FlgM
VKHVQAPQKVAGRQIAKGDRVQISERAREMQATLEQVKKMPDVDEAKVALIKAQLKAGTYQADSGTVAEKMLTESLTGQGE